MAASHIFPKGTTSKIIEVVLRNSTTGQPLTGKLFSDMTIAYHRQGAAKTAVTEVTMTAGTWASGGFKETDDTGIYQFGIPDAALATGTDSVVITFTCSGAITVVKEIILSDPIRGVGAPTALPNAAADAAGGLPISDAGGLDLDTKLANTNEVTAARMGALTDWIDGGRLDLIVDAILLDTGTDGVVVAAASKTGYSLTATTGLGNQTANITGTITTATNVTTVNGLAAGVITAASIATGAVDADALAADAGTEIGTAVWASATRVLTAATNITSDASAITMSSAGVVGTVNLVNTVTTLTNLPAITSNWLTAAGIAADAVTELRSYVSGTADSGSTTTMVDAARTEADADYWKGKVILFTSGTIAGQARIITDFNATTDTITFAPATTQAVGTNTYEILPWVSVWDDTIAEHLGVGSTGESLNAAGAAGDPWTTALPGAYGAGSAGFILGTNLDALISSRMATFTLPTGFLSATFPTTIASTTNITAGTITTTTNLTNLPAITANWLTATGIAANAITAAKIADGAIDAATFAADVDAEILSYLVDDATRIDASSLNTATVTTIPTNLDATVSSRSTLVATDIVSAGAITTSSGAVSTVTTLTNQSNVVLSGTAAAATSTTITLDGSASSTSSLYVGELISIYSSTGAGQVRTITVYDGTTKVATIDRAWTTTPSGTSKYRIMTANTAALNDSLQMLASTNEQLVSTSISGVTSQTVMTLTAGSDTDDSYNGCYAVITSQGSATKKAVVAISDYVGSTRTITLVAAAPFTVVGTDGIIIFANSLASSTLGGFTTAGKAEVESEVNDAMVAFGTATAANQATIIAYIDTEIAAILAAVDTEITAIKAKTDQFVFTIANQVDSNALTGGGGATAAAVADAVWDELLSGHAISGSAGEALSAAGSAGNPWITALPGAYVSGTAGFIIGTYLTEDTANPSVTISAAAAALDNVADGGKLTIHRGDYTSFQLTGLGSLVGRTGEKLFFTIKTAKDNDLTDADAIVQVTETTGAVRVNGATIASLSIVASDASITVDDASTGSVTFVLKAAITKLLVSATRLYYDVQIINSAGQPQTLTSGNVRVNADVTRRQDLT